MGDTYIGRMSEPYGYELVAVPDEVREPYTRPRRTIVVVADGLGGDFARGLKGMAQLAARGTCRTTDVGLPTVSRPVYAVISTGVEQDRTGIRNNDEDRPIAAESLWQVARDAGLVVEGRSELPWFQQLFPGGFDRYEELPRSAAYLSPVPTADLSLLHPVYLDELGHDHGAASAEYRDGVARFDAELVGLLASVDLARDLVLVTADHGHSARGGHGGPQPEIRLVWTCLAGPGVRPGRDDTVISARAIAPLLAVLLGVRFPRHLRPDGAEAIWDIATGGSPAYLGERQAALARFRVGNPPWEARYADGDALHMRKLALAGLALVFLFGAVTGLRRGRGEAAGLAVWMLVTVAVMVLLHLLVLGSFDVTAINRRERWVLRVCVICGLTAAAALGLRWRWTRRWDRSVGDLALLTALGLAANLLLPWVWGAPLDFPAPPPLFYFLPFWVSGATLCLAGVTAVAALSLAWAPAAPPAPSPRPSRRRSSRRRT